MQMNDFQKLKNEKRKRNGHGPYKDGEIGGDKKSNTL